MINRCKTYLLTKYYFSVFFKIYQADLPASGLYSGHEMHSYLAQDDDLGGPRAVKDTKSIGSEYDRYLQNEVTFLSI